MARAPDKRIEQAKAMYLKGMKLVEIASQLNLPEGTVRRWKSAHRWDNERSDKKSERSDKKKRGEHGHHHADDVFTSWGKETPHKFERAKLEEILKQFVEDDKILRSKGMVEGTDGKWIYFDMVPGEYEIRDGEPCSTE